MDMQEMVKKFHKKHEFPIGIPMFDARRVDKQVSEDLDAIGKVLVLQAKLIQRVAIDTQEQEDDRLYRAHLMLEELGEVLIAMGGRNEAEVFDGLCDLLYVVFGTGVALDLPLRLGFGQVHASNMSKKLKTEDNIRMRDKGKDYVHPRLDLVLDNYRKGENYGCRI